MTWSQLWQQIKDTENEQLGSRKQQRGEPTHNYHFIVNSYKFIKYIRHYKIFPEEQDNRQQPVDPCGPEEEAAQRFTTSFPS